MDREPTFEGRWVMGALLSRYLTGAVRIEGRFLTGAARIEGRYLTGVVRI